MSHSEDRARFLAAYDANLRTDAETPSALKVTQHGPLRWVTFMKGRGFVTYQDLGDADAHTIKRLVAESVAYYRAEQDITRVEWKSRGHDHAPGLHEALINNGFTQDDPESIMIGEAQALSTAVPLPDGVTLRQVTDEADVRAMSAMQDEVFGEPVSDEMADALLRRLSLADGMQLWVAEADGKIVSAGRLEPVPGTAFAGIWGGATQGRMARTGDLQGIDGPSRASRTRDGKDPHPQRLHRVLAANPGTFRAAQGVHHDAVPLGARLKAQSALRVSRRLHRSTAKPLRIKFPRGLTNSEFSYLPAAK